MGLDTHNPLTEMKITQVVCASLAIITTVIRLIVRRGRLWWDDACAFFAMLCIMLQTAAVFMRLSNPNIISKPNKVAAYYLMTTCFSCIIWFSRLSILFSVLRVEPSPIRRKRLFVVAAGFLLALILLLAQIYTICERQKGWKDLPAPACHPSKAIAIAQLVTDIIADGILLAAPLQLLKGLQDRRLYRRLVLIFSTCVATTIVSLVHAAYIVKNEGTPVIISALVENGISLMVCNLPVIVATLMRAHAASSTANTKSSSEDRVSHLRFTSPHQRERTQTEPPGSRMFGASNGGVKISTVTWDDSDSTTHELGLVKRDGDSEILGNTTDGDERVEHYKSQPTSPPPAHLRSLG